MNYHIRSFIHHNNIAIFIYYFYFYFFWLYILTFFFSNT